MELDKKTGFKSLFLLGMITLVKGEELSEYRVGHFLEDFIDLTIFHFLDSISAFDLITYAFGIVFIIGIVYGAIRWKRNN